MKLSLTLAAILFFTVGFAQKTYWQADVTTGEFGLLKTNFIVSEEDKFIFGTTIPNAQKRIIGGLKGSLAKGMFQKDGSLMELDSLTIIDNKVTGYLLLQKKKYYLEGTKIQNKIVASIKGKTSGLIYGKLEAIEKSVLDKPKNYTLVWNDMKDLTEKYIYKKDVLKTKEWMNFVKYMDEFSKVAEDDAEFVFGFFYKAKDLPFTHYAVEGNKELATNYSIARLKKPDNKVSPNLSLLNEQTFLLDVPAFDFRANEIDTLMLQIVNSKVKNLIIDLRNNPGGDMEGAMRICQYITNEPIYGGIMLSQAYWNKNTSPPVVENYSNFKVMNTANYEWFKNEVKNNIEGLCIMTNPLKETFKGKIYILTSDITASTSEPFVYTLQMKNIAKIIGGKTAGAMLSMESFYVQNLKLSIPMLDYYTFDGKRLDRIGVKPDILCEPKDALNIALNEILKE